MNKFVAFYKKNEKACVFGVAGLVVVLVGWFVFSVGTGGSGTTDDIGQGNYFTIDDGVTYFRGSANDVPPFMSGGKTAYGAHLGSDGAKMKVYYLDRLVPEAREALINARAGKPVDSKGGVLLSNGQGREYKRVGESKWLKFKSDSEKVGWLSTFKDSNGKPVYGLW